MDGGWRMEEEILVSSSNICRSSATDILPPTRCPQAGDTKYTAGSKVPPDGAIGSAQSIALYSKVKTVLRQDRCIQDLDADEYDPADSLNVGDEDSDHLLASMPTSFAQGRSCEEEEVAQRLSFDSNESTVKVDETYQKRRFPLSYIETSAESPAGCPQIVKKVRTDTGSISRNTQHAAENGVGGTQSGTGMRLSGAWRDEVADGQSVGEDGGRMGRTGSNYGTRENVSTGKGTEAVDKIEDIMKNGCEVLDRDECPQSGQSEDIREEVEVEESSEGGMPTRILGGEGEEESRKRLRIFGEVDTAKDKEKIKRQNKTEETKRLQEVNKNEKEILKETENRGKEAPRHGETAGEDGDDDMPLIMPLIVMHHNSAVRGQGVSGEGAQGALGGVLEGERQSSRQNIGMKPQQWWITTRPDEDIDDDLSLPERRERQAIEFKSLQEKVQEIEKLKPTRNELMLWKLFGEGRVSARYSGDKKWYPGRIDKVHADGCVAVKFEDGSGDSEESVKPRHIRLLLEEEYRSVTGGTCYHMCPEERQRLRERAKRKDSKKSKADKHKRKRPVFNESALNELLSAKPKPKSSANGAWNTGWYLWKSEGMDEKNYEEEEGGNGTFNLRVPPKNSAAYESQLKKLTSLDPSEKGILKVEGKDGMSISVARLEELCEVLTNNMALRKLDFDGTQIGDKGLETLCDMLRVNTKIDKIDLQGCSISDVGFKILVDALKVREIKMQELYMSRNDITDAIQDQIIDLCYHYPALKFYSGNTKVSENVRCLTEEAVETRIRSLILQKRAAESAAAAAEEEEEDERPLIGDGELGGAFATERRIPLHSRSCTPQDDIAATLTAKKLSRLKRLPFSSSDSSSSSSSSSSYDDDSDHSFLDMPGEGRRSRGAPAVFAAVGSSGRGADAVSLATSDEESHDNKIRHAKALATTSSKDESPAACASEEQNGGWIDSGDDFRVERQRGSGRGKKDPESSWCSDGHEAGRSSYKDEEAGRSSHEDEDAHEAGRSSDEDEEAQQFHDRTHSEYEEEDANTEDSGGEADRNDEDIEEDERVQPSGHIQMSKKVEKIVQKIGERNGVEVNLMHKNMIPCEQFRFLFHAVRTRKFVTKKLDLSNNEQLGDQGIRSLVDTLLKSGDCTLEWLDLGKGTLSNMAIPTLFEGLECATSIKYVDLRANKLDHNGWRDIKERLKQMKDRELTIAILNKKESSEKYRGEFDANLCSAYIPPPEERDFQSDECQSNDDEESDDEFDKLENRGGGRGATGGKRRMEHPTEDDYLSGDLSGESFGDAARSNKHFCGNGRKKTGIIQSHKSRRDEVQKGHSKLSSSSLTSSSSHPSWASCRSVRAGGGGGGTVKSREGASKSASKKHKGPKISSHSRGCGSGGSRGSREQSSYIQHKSAPTAYGFGALLPPRLHQVGAIDGGRTGTSGGSARPNDQDRHVDDAGSAQKSMYPQQQTNHNQFKDNEGKQPAAGSQYAMLAATSREAAREGRKLNVGQSKYEFPRSLPLHSMKLAYEQRFRINSQWLIAEHLEQMQLEFIQRNDTPQTIEEGFEHCKVLLRNLISNQPVGADGWTSATSINFFEFVLVELRNMSADTSSDLMRTRSYVIVLQQCDDILKRGGSLIKGLECPSGRLAWLRLYTQFNFYLLQWLQVMEGPAWNGATSAAATRAAAEEDGIDLRQNYTFAQHSSRLLRVLLFVADKYSSELFDCLRQRLGPMRENSANDDMHASIECLFELWAKMIRLQDAAERAETRFWQLLTLMFDEYRWSGSDGYYFTLPHLQPAAPTMSKSKENSDYYALLASSTGCQTTCSKEEAMEFWWIVTALSTLLYHIYDIPHLGGWDLLSRLLANSPLMPRGGSMQFREGTIFKVTKDFEKMKSDYLIEIVDRCSLMATLWPYNDLNGRYSFANINLLRDLSMADAGKKPCKGLISELWRLASTEEDDKRAQHQQASNEDLARIGNLPINYPFCSQNEAVSWIKDHGGGQRTLCGAVAWLIQNLVLRAQSLRHTEPQSCREEFAKDFGRLYSTLQQHHLFKVNPLRLDPAWRTGSEEPAPCREYKELRIFRSNLLLMSVLMQLAPEQHKSVAGHAEIFQRIEATVCIPQNVNPNWHFNTGYIEKDREVRKAFITACLRNLECLAARNPPLPFMHVAETLQKMLKLAVLETPIEVYSSGNDVSTLAERKEATAQSDQGTNFISARDAEYQREFCKLRVKYAKDVIVFIMERMGGFIRKWLSDCEKSIQRGLEFFEERCSIVDQASESFNTQHGHLQLFGIELVHILKAKDCGDDLLLQVWQFLEGNLLKLNEISQKMVSFIDGKYGVDNPVPVSVQSSLHDGEEDEESFDWDAAERGDLGRIKVSAQDARASAMCLTKKVFSNASVESLFKAAMLNSIRRLKQLRMASEDGVKDQVIRDQAIRTCAAVAVTFFRVSAMDPRKGMKWQEFEPHARLLEGRMKTAFEERQELVAIFCRVLDLVRPDVSLLDSQWLSPDVNCELVRIWFLGMFERSVKASAQNVQLELTNKLAQMPLMHGVHQAMVLGTDSTLRRPKFPHLYGHPQAPSCLLVPSDETTTTMGNTFFRQRIQGLRRFADLLHNAPERDTTSLVKTLKGWKEAVWREGQEIEPRHRVVYQIFSLEAFAVLFPCCAVYLHKGLTLTSQGINSNALIDLCDYFFETSNDPAETWESAESAVAQVDHLRMLQARLACVPAAILGIVQLDSNKRLVETCRSLLKFVLRHKPMAEAGASAREGVLMRVATSKETMLEVFNILFMRNYDLSNGLSHGKECSVLFLNKFFVYSFFQTLASFPDALECPASDDCATHTTATRACAAAEMVKDLLKFLQHRNDKSCANNSDSVSLETIERILRMTVVQLSQRSQENDVVGSLWLLEILDAALSARALYLPGRGLDIESAESTLDDLMTWRVGVALCQAFPTTDQKECDRHWQRHLHEKSIQARQAFSEVHGTVDLGDAASQRLLESVLKLGDLVDPAQPLAVERVKRLADRNVALTDLCEAAVKVLKSMLGTCPRQFMGGWVQYMDDLVFRSAVTATRASLWSDFSRVASQNPNIARLEGARMPLSPATSEVAVVESCVVAAEVGFHLRIAAAVSASECSITGGEADAAERACRGVPPSSSSGYSGKQPSVGEGQGVARNEAWLVGVDVISDSENEE